MLTGSETQPSVQEEIFKTLLRTPHRSVDEVLRIHFDQLQRDPYLYGCLAVYAVLEGQCAVRDLQDVFVATLFISEFPEHREAAWVMLQGLPPHRAERVVRYVTGYAEIVTHTSKDGPMPAQGEFGVSYERAKDRSGKEIARRVQKIGRRLRRHIGNVNELTIDKWLVKHECHKRPLNRVAKNAIFTYLRSREEDRNWMEGSILRSRNSMKYLYAKCHLVPEGRDDGWVNRALFHGEAPEGSRLDAQKKLIASTDPAEQAQIIMDAKLPFTVVQSLVKTVTPSVLIALIDSMSPQELLQSLAKLKREGAFSNPEIKELVQKKIQSIKRAKPGKVDAFKGEIAAEKVADLDDETKAMVSEVTDAQLKQHGKIGVPSMLLIDTSWSMERAIKEGKRVGATLAQASGDNFRGCYLFGSTARRVNWLASDGDITQYSAWQKKFKMVRADGGTNLGACLTAMIRNDEDVEQIIILTDEGENGHPYFYEKLPAYKERFGHLPEIIIVRLDGTDVCDKVERTCKQAGAEVTLMDCTKTDKIALPNLIRLCSKKSIFDLIQDVLDLPLPTKNDWLEKQKSSTSRASKTKTKKCSGQPAMAL